MAQIKRIQLRGISRTPSDRMTEDGGCAESLNAYLDSGETAPVLKPEDITASLGIPDVKDVEKVFIHKTTSAENYIVFVRDDDHCLSARHYVDGESNEIVLLERDGAVRDVASVGNTLIIAGSECMHYALYAEGKYKYLGTKIPEPRIEFRCNSLDHSKIAKSVHIDLLKNVTSGTPISEINPDAWQKAAEDIRYGISNDETEELLAIQNDLWGLISIKVQELTRDGLFVAPMLARYAVKLYDGSYIYQSVPILLGAGFDKWADIYASYDVFTPFGLDTTVWAKMQNVYTASAHLIKWDVEGWEDIVDSVAIFVSSDICYPVVNANIAGLTLRSITNNEAMGVQHSVFDINFFNNEMSDMDALEKEILSKSSFFKVASFPANGTEKLSEGFDMHEGDDILPQEKRMTKEQLPDYEQSGTQIVPSSLMTYNGRLLATGGERVLSSGYHFIQSTNIVDVNNASTNRAFAYNVHGSDKTYRVLARSSEDEFLMQPYGMEVTSDGNKVNSYAKAFGLVFYPDPRCKEVELWDESGDVFYIEMKAHPFLNCSYAFWGLSKTIEECPGQVAGDVTLGVFTSKESRYERDTQRVYQSEMNNPFYFPISGNKSFSAKLIGLATASAPLSQGQFGQFPLYVFTEDGIWAMETAADGSFLSSKPLSREVCSNPASITPIDQAVIFMSDKGLMLLQGSQITELSPYMNGKHYMINPTARTIIDGLPEFCNLLGAVEDDTPFMAFMKDAEIGYDYQGKRLVCFNKNKAYQYVYKLDTQTWHKTFHTDAVSDAVPLNSYPRCEAMVKSVTGSTRIIDFSTSLDGSKEELPERGVIVTRPFDMDEPDVLKTITDVRVRGQFAKGAVKFILLGSQDGINFYTISTLRGKAWKMFRLVLLTNLDVHDRLSWVDVMYESRFTNRLR